MSVVLFIKCKICNRDCNGLRGLGAHIKSHGLTSKEYYNLYLSKPTEGFCKCCNKPTQFLDIGRGYRIYCSDKCAVNDPDYIKRLQNTKLKKYGSKTFSNREKAKNTCLERYGNPTYNNPKKIQETTFERYGINLYSKTDECKKKVKETTFKKYNKDYYTQTDEYKIRAIETCLEKYGTKYYTQSAKYKENVNDYVKKAQQTCIEKYGVSNISYLPDLYKGKKSIYYYDNLNFDSSWELAYYIWLKDNNINFEYHPKIHFDYIFKNKLHKYFPDFIVNDNIVEVKGLHFFENFDITQRMICPYNREFDELAEAKHKCMIEHNVEIITDCSLYLNYINEMYGKNYLNQFKKQIG